MEKPRVFLAKKEKFGRKEATLRRREKTVMFKHTTAFLFLTLLALAPLSAQSSKVAVEGAVIDSTGGVLVGTDVFLRNSRSGLEIHQVTDGQGRYQFMVAPGRYELTAAETGFESVTKTLDVTDAKGVQLDLELAPEILADQVVVVSGSREQELSENSTTKVDIIPSTMLHDTGYETVRDVLSEEPGIITRSGSSGNRSETQIQGIDSRQSLILIDGLPIVGAKGIKSGILNMDRQSVGRLDRIEIVKGASSALYGSDAIGGVINMITREAHPGIRGQRHRQWWNPQPLRRPQRHGIHQGQVERILRSGTAQAESLQPVTGRYPDHGVRFSPLRLSGQAGLQVLGERFATDHGQCLCQSGERQVPGNLWTHRDTHQR